MIALGCDHGGYELMQEVIKHLEERGISISANKIKGIRAALCHDCFSAQATREHNDANMLAMGARVIGPGLALKIVDIFLDTPFSNDERHVRRIGMIE